VQFAHGVEGSPQGAKAKALDAHFEACTPAMTTRDFPSCVALHAESIAAFRPDVLVGSSFGGAVVGELLRAGRWRGATLLLAPALGRLGPGFHLPDGVRVVIVHARRDDVVPIDGSRSIVRDAKPSLVTLHEVDDDHALHALVADGRLIDHVREAAGLSPTL